MVHVSTIFSVERLQEEIDGKWITVRPHATLSYNIYNYSDNAQFARHWNEVTLNCRGLILDESLNVIARPWKKFFNLGEGNMEIDMTMPVEVTDKMDGSLGILYPTGNGYAISTRGSFDSDQAKHGTRLLSKYDGVVYDAAEQFTFLFEIVYPSNRIVLSYGEMDDLVILGAVNIEYGYYIGPRESATMINWSGPATKVFGYKTMQEAFNNNERRNAEGYVIRSGNSLVKLKQCDYVELHRIVTNFSERTVWELMCKGKTIEEIVAPLPDELHSWAIGIYNDIDSARTTKINEVVDEYLKVPRGLDRKGFASVVSKSKNAHLLFNLFDYKPISQTVLESLKPAFNKE